MLFGPVPQAAPAGSAMNPGQNCVPSHLTSVSEKKYTLFAALPHTALAHVLPA
jgi:hypothetical protein